jgi:hypothetical protein
MRGTQWNAYLPADLAYEPPHERRSQHEVVLGVSRYGVQAKHDCLGTLFLRTHWSRWGCRHHSVRKLLSGCNNSTLTPLFGLAAI